MRSRWLRTLLAIGGLASGAQILDSPANAQAVAVGSVTLSALLGRLTDQVQQLIEQARNGARSVEIEGGIQVLNAIANAREAYSESMNETVDRLDGAVKGNIDKLSGEVQQLEQHAAADANALANRLDVIVKSLPFRKHQPFLMSTTPSFVAIGDAQAAEAIVMVLNGSFEEAGNADHAPTLHVLGSTLKPAQTQTNGLTFALPRDQLVRARLANQFAVVHADLHVPWTEDHWYGDRHRESVFPVIVGIVPTVPGALSVTVSFTAPSSVQRHYTGPNHHLSSQREGGNDDHKDVPSSDSATPGCSIVRDSVRVVGSGHGDQSYGLTSVTTTAVASVATTIHHGAGESGVNDYWIEFNETCPSSTPGTNTYEFDSRHGIIGWKETKTISFPAPPAHVDSYVVKFVGFDGTKIEWASPNTSRILTVKATGNGLELTVADPAQLKWY